MNTRDAVMEILWDIVPDIEPDEISGETNYREAFNVDSMDFMAILERVSEEFSVEVPEDDYASVQTLDGLTAYVETHT